MAPWRHPTPRTRGSGVGGEVGRVSARTPIFRVGCYPPHPCPSPPSTRERGKRNRSRLRSPLSPVLGGEGSGVRGDNATDRANVEESKAAISRWFSSALPSPACQSSSSAFLFLPI